VPFPAAVKFTFPFPVPLLLPEITNQSALLLTAVQEHVLGVTTLKVPTAPPMGTADETGASE
jgi:hypothetical protein